MSYVSTVGHIKHQSTTLIGEIAGWKLQLQSSRVFKRLGSWKIDPFFFLPSKDIKGSIKKSLHHSFALVFVPLVLPFLLFFWGLRHQHPRIAVPPDWQRGSRFSIMLITVDDKRWWRRLKNIYDSDLILQLAAVAHRWVILPHGQIWLPVLFLSIFVKVCSLRPRVIPHTCSCVTAFAPVSTPGVDVCRSHRSVSVCKGRVFFFARAWKEKWIKRLLTRFFGDLHVCVKRSAAEWGHHKSAFLSARKDFIRREIG